MSFIDVEKVQKSADYIRYLALAAIERAKSGHPGLPLGCADLGILLYRYLLKFNPEKPHWINRDRFVLSAGHGSMFLYPLLYSAGYQFRLKDLENFRQLGSKTPGHPEYDLDLGIETTTGPLGQGFANAVGMAIEGKILAQTFNRENFNLFDYTIYTLMGDGCNMEGISYETGSMAGHLGLDNLVAIYDSNHITIDGRTDITFTEDVGKRYEALGWLVDEANINNPTTVYDKLLTLKKAKGKPKLLILTTTIGQGLDKKRDSSGIHGAPAGIGEIVYFIQNSTVKELFMAEYGEQKVSDSDQLTQLITHRIENRLPLLSNDDHLEFMQEERDNCRNTYETWGVTLEDYKSKYPEEYESLVNFSGFSFPEELKSQLLLYREEKPDATRNISGRILNICADQIRQLIGGTADLAGSTKASIKSSHYISSADFSGRNIAFGVREHGMAAIGNGLALNKNIIPFTSTFFTFFDYMKPSVRLAALMKLNHLFIFSHDSIYVGEDGPTHQAIEHLNSLRLLPGIYTFRPANDIETAFTFLYFLERLRGPMAIVTTRQKVAAEMQQTSLDRAKLYNQFSNGGYIFYETQPSKSPDVVLCGSGSEVYLAMQTAQLLEERDGKNVRVVSIPCLELLSEAGQEYHDQILGSTNAPLVFIETASHRGINLFYQRKIILIDIQSFGESAPGKVAAEHFGFTPESIYKKILEKG